MFDDTDHVYITILTLTDVMMTTTSMTMMNMIKAVTDMIDNDDPLMLHCNLSKLALVRPR